MKKILLPFGLFFLLLLHSAFAETPHGMTKAQITTWATSHWQIDQIVPLLVDLNTLLYNAPAVTGPKMVAVLGNDGTLHVYWTSPNMVMKWADPNNPSRTLLQTEALLPTLTQPNFYKPPKFPIGAVAIAAGSGLVVGGLAVAILFLLK